MNVLITGSSGMLGATLVDNWQNKFDVFATDIVNYKNNSARHFYLFDLLYPNYDELLEWARPDIIVHCAAITNVDYCEEYPDKTMAVNGESVNKFLQSDAHARLIFISSEAVFPDGLHLVTENDKTGPENVYGKSKELGERYIQNAYEPHCAIRTTIVGKNINPSKQGFVEWVVNSVRNGKEITLFEDAFFTPITIWHLEKHLKWVMENDISTIIHITGKDPVSKYDFGFSICDKLGLDTSLIKKGSISNITFKAKRSKDQTMDATHYERISNRNLPRKEDTIDLIVKHFKEYTHV